MHAFRRITTAEIGNPQCESIPGSRSKGTLLFSQSIGLYPLLRIGHQGRAYLLLTKFQVYITKSPSPQLVPLNGGFYQHPDFPPGNTAGFVTITGETPPTLRWIYLDPQTHEMRWGGKQDSEGNICGPFDWTQDEEQITLQGWEGWLAVRLPDDEKNAERLGVENGQELWRLYFDQHDNGADLPPGAEALEITIKRTVAQS